MAIILLKAMEAMDSSSIVKSTVYLRKKNQSGWSMGNLLIFPLKFIILNSYYNPTLYPNAAVGTFCSEYSATSYG